MEKNPLSVEHLRGAEYLSLGAAVLTDRDQFPPGSGDAICRIHHQRLKRFEIAVQKMQTGITSLSDLGLLPEDCKWAADQAERAKDPEDWRRRFTLAAEKLAARKEASEYPQHPLMGSQFPGVV